MTASVYATGRHSSFRTMDLSTQMIRKIFAEKEREILEDNREDNIKYIDNLWKNILESEENIISSSPEGKKYFPKENIKRMRISLRSSQQEQIKELDWTGQGKLKWKILLPFMNTEKLSDEVDKNYYNINVMKVVSNIVTKLNSAPVDPYELLPSEKFNTWLTHLQRMGAESVFGVAMKASLGEEPNTDLKPSQLPLDNLFVIKAPRKKSSDDTLLHEMFIGIFGTNKLREFLPNIAYIYGGFKCSPPYFDADSKDVLNFCSNDDEKVQVNYIVYENVARNEAKSLGKFVQTCTAQEYLEVILQIAFTLRKAHELCNFTHYDLHDENVIIRSMPKKIALTYETELGINQYLHTDYIATIIDLGSAHIRYQGVNFGYIHTGLATRGVSPNRSFVLFDIYKILCFSLYSMGSSQTGGATFNVMKSLLTFFNQTDTPEQLLINQREFYYSLPYTREIQNGSVTLDDFIKFIRFNFNLTDFLRDSTDREVFGCEGSAQRATGASEMRGGSEAIGASEMRGGSEATGAVCKNEREITRELLDDQILNDQVYLANMDIRIFADFIIHLGDRERKFEVLKKYIYYSIFTNELGPHDSPFAYQINKAMEKINHYSVLCNEIYNIPIPDIKIGPTLLRYPEEESRIKIDNIRRFIQILNTLASLKRKLNIFARSITGLVKSFPATEELFGAGEDSDTLKPIFDSYLIEIAEYFQTLKSNLDQYDEYYDNALMISGNNLNQFKNFLQNKSNKRQIRPYFNNNFPEVLWLDEKYSKELEVL